MELRDSGRRVLLVESGGEQIDAATTDLYAGESVGRPIRSLTQEIALDAIRLRFFGGTTNHWAGACRPLRPVDFEPRDGLAVSGWPIAHADLLPYWARAADYVRITDAEFDPLVWSQRTDLPPPILDTETIETIVFQNTAPTRFGDLYGGDLAASDSVEVWQWANLVNLGTDGSHITHADLRTLDGVALRVEADAFVLACGGIENARLLLASTDADPAGIGNETDQVGRHFCEHFQIYAGFGLLDVPSEEMRAFDGTQVTLTEGRHAGFVHGVKHAWSLTDDYVRTTATTGMEVQLVVGAFPDITWKQSTGADATQVGALLGRSGRAPGSAVYLQVLAEQPCNPDSRVSLADTRDALGMRRVRLDWQYGPPDRHRILAGLRAIAEEIGSVGLGRLQLTPGGVGVGLEGAIRGEFLTAYECHPDRIDETDFPIGVGFHHMCTTRMSTDPADGVVDGDCRVHSVDNLWVAGSSVFGTAGVATPTFSIVALAIRLADHLRDAT
jgi:choline dehydrogenase-like flavoprotein